MQLVHRRLVSFPPVQSIPRPACVLNVGVWLQCHRRFGRLGRLLDDECRNRLNPWTAIELLANCFRSPLHARVRSVG